MSLSVLQIVFLVFSHTWNQFDGRFCPLLSRRDEIVYRYAS